MLLPDAFIDRLRSRLTEPLPGPEAQFRMAFARRVEELRRNPLPPPDARVACVLNLLHHSNGEWRTLLIQRTTNPRDRHSGQVSFPGGRYEESDGDLVNVGMFDQDVFETFQSYIAMVDLDQTAPGVGQVRKQEHCIPMNCRRYC